MTARERGKCECSLMAKLELPKLASWVRFPSLAPKPTIFVGFLHARVERIFEEKKGDGLPPSRIYCDQIF